MIQFSAKSILSLSLMLFLLTLASAQLESFANPTNMLVGICGHKPIINMSGVEGNLKVVLNSLVENVNKTGYNISWYGENGDTVYGLAQCRGDLNASTCRACVSYATEFVTSEPVCGNSSSSRSIYVSGCVLKYATQNFYTSYDADQSELPSMCDNSTVNGTVGNRGNLDWKISPVLTRVMASAVSSNVSYSTLSYNGVYSLAQCWRDLTMNQCNQCLNSNYNNLDNCPTGTIGGASMSDGCMIQFATNEKFYGDGIPLLSPTAGTAPSLQPSTAPSLQPFKGAGKNRPHLSLMLKLSVAGIVIVVVLLLTGLVIIWKGKYKKQLVLGVYTPSSELSTAISKSRLNYKFQTLRTATNNFNPTNKIGQGGFGSVYKGVLRDGREIAVKRLFSGREQSVSDFFNEVNLISRVQHKNLVKLLGCSVDGKERLLVYEYLPNKSLDRFLFDENMGHMLYWERRFEIILGIAGGLAYLHQESDTRIIHRDIKASNTLLDQNFKPKIADFGLVRYFAEDETHLSTTIVGTRGYMAPEYLVHGHLTEKVDVYAFGVLVLEIISGRKNIMHMKTNDMPSLLTVVWNHYLSSMLSNIIDCNIQQICKEDLLQVVHIALLCTQTSAVLRPSMSKVILFLTSKDQNIPAATHPPFINDINLQSNINTSVSYSSSQSNTNAGVESNHSQSNINQSVPHVLSTSHPSNIASSCASEKSLNTISTSSFGPR